MQNSESGVGLSPNTKFTLPSGHMITVREQNAEDEADLTRESPDPNATGMDIFLTNLVEFDSRINGKPMLSDILNWGIKDKYYALMKSRMFSLGYEVPVKADCSNGKCNHVHDLIADLRPFDKDFKNPDTLFKDEQGRDIIPSKEFQVTAYPSGTTKQVTAVLKSGKQVRYEILDSYGERQIYDVENTSNLIFTARKLEILRDSGKWEPVLSFREFSSRDTAELRGSIDAMDLSFAPVEKVTCPKCGTKDIINLMYQPGFFFPRG